MAAAVRIAIGQNEGMAATRFDLVTIDGDTRVLASFWSAALSLVQLECEDDGRWIVLGTPDGMRRIGLQRGLAQRGGVHLDLACSITDFDSELLRLADLGARIDRPARHEPYGRIVNMADPEGNVFDLSAYNEPA